MIAQAAALDLMFHALADPARRGMLERLTHGPASVSELARPHTMTLAAIGQHLAVLEQGGLVRSEKIGRTRTYTLEPKGMRTAEQWISERRTEWEQRADRLGQWLADNPEPSPDPER